jgi:hypothetical protein
MERLIIEQIANGYAVTVFASDQDDEDSYRALILGRRSARPKQFFFRELLELLTFIGRYYEMRGARAEVLEGE